MEFTIKAALGTSQCLYNNYSSQGWELSSGSPAAPVTTAGPLFKISKTECLDVVGVNPADNESNAAFSCYSIGNPGSKMQTNAALFAAKGSPVGTDVVGLCTTGLVNGSGNGVGTGAYIEGRRDTTTGKMMGAEVRVTNYTTTPVSYYPLGFNSSGLWITAGGLANSPAGVTLGTVSGQKWDVGFAATASSVASQTFRDDSSSITSVDINGSHTDGIDLTGGTFSGSPLLAPLTTPSSATATGKTGAIKWDANYIYVCTASNTWKRVALATW